MRDQKFLTIVVVVMVAIDGLWQSLVYATSLMFPRMFETGIAPIAVDIDGVMGLFKLATMIVFGVWMYRAGKNLADADLDGLEFSSGSRIWWFAVPIANLVKPHHGMRELWNASRGNWPYERNEPMIGLWWALWLVSGILGWFTASTDAEPMFTTGRIVVSGVDIALAIVAIRIVRGIDHGQRTATTSQLGDVFA